MEDIDNLEFTELILKGDGESALAQVMNEVKRQRSHKTILELPLAYDQCLMVQSRRQLISSCASSGLSK